MRKPGRFVLIAGLFPATAGFLTAQTFEPPQITAAPEMIEMQKVQERIMKAADPEFCVFQERLREAEAKIAEVSAGFVRGDIDKDEATSDMIPLLQQERDIQENPEFQAEQRLSQAIFSTPEFQKKMEGAMRAFEKSKKKRAVKR